MFPSSIIQESFINMENMLELMSEPQEIKDLPNALPVVATQGHIEFRNVNFHYTPERQILKNLSFVAEPGQTVALVVTIFMKYVAFCQIRILLGGSHWEWKEHCNSTSLPVLRCPGWCHLA